MDVDDGKMDDDNDDDQMHEGRWTLWRLQYK